MCPWVEVNKLSDFQAVSNPFGNDGRKHPEIFMDLFENSAICRE